MLKKFLVLFLISATGFSQNFVKGTMDPYIENYENAIIYQLKGAKQLYVNYASIDKTSGNFSIEMPEKSENGIYRLMYDFENNGYVDFMYSNKNVNFKFDPTFPSGTVVFANSSENTLYTNYLNESTNILHKLDSIQLVYFNLNEEQLKKKTQKEYNSTRKKYIKVQTEYEEKTNNSFVNNFIKAYKKVYAENPVETPQEYLNFVGSHYFDAIDFNDETLLNSSFLSERVIEFVFYLNGSDDTEVQNLLYKTSVIKVMELISNPIAKNDVLISLLYAFANKENHKLLDYTIEEYYNKLPAELISKEVIDEVQDKVRLSIGKKAPDFSFEKGKELVKLFDLDKAERFILVFWSTTCSHCLEEVPGLYEYIKNDSKTQVIAIALEKDELGFNHHTEKFTKWINVLGLEKWENPIARTYKIHSTPSYFILDKDKNIISKPDYFSDVKKYFDEIRVEEAKAEITSPNLKEEVKQVYTHTVVKGDTLFLIAKKYNVTIEELKKINKISSNNLTIGQTLKIKTNE